MKRPDLGELLGGGKAKAVEVDVVGEGGGEKAAAAKEVLRAVKDEDADMLASALGAFVDLHMSEEHDEEADEEQDAAEDGDV